MLQTHYLTVNSLKSLQKPQSAILPETFAIALWDLLTPMFAIPILVALHVLFALFWGTLIVFQLLSGKELFYDEGGL